MAFNRRRFPVAFLLCLCVLALLLTPATGAGAITAQQVKDAKARVADLKRQIAAEQADLAVIAEKANAAAEALLVAQDQLDKIQADLTNLQQQLADAKAEYVDVTTQLNERARQAFISGPGSQVEFFLGATSLADLSDRLEFMSAVAQSDADLAQQVQNLKNQLSAQETRVQQLKRKQQELVAEKKQRDEEIQAQFDQQAALVSSIEAKTAEAERQARKISKEFAQQQFGPSIGNGVFKYCPVDQPRAFGDGFGAPRYAGGYHLHAGVDIIAPEGTIIRAPFDGTARASSNTLGGLAVYVYGASGYVYNAHLSGYSDRSNGPVQAGDIIGYVGWTGDAMGGVYHDHFEYHPNTIPANWPTSSYGYSVVGDAINPYPLLVEACL